MWTIGVHVSPDSGSEPDHHPGRVPSDSRVSAAVFKHGKLVFDVLDFLNISTF